MRSLDEVQLRAREDGLPRPDQLALRLAPFLQPDAGERARPPAVVLDHVDEPFTAVIVVEQRGVEAGRVDVVGVRPGAFDAVSRDDVVGRVLEGPVLALDVRVHEEELGAIVREARRPDAAAVGVASHVKLRFAVQRPRGERPVDEVFRVVDLHARVPFEGRRCDVVVFAHAQDRGVGIEAWEDGVQDFRHLGGGRRR